MSNKRKPKLVVLSAPSGAGKSTLASMLLARHPNFKLSVSHTTRPPRGEEKHGVHYFFVNEQEFKRMVSAGEFLEHALVFGKSWYGTSRAFVDATLKGGHNVLFDIDVQGAHSLKNSFKDESVTIFILPPSFEELEKRLRNRKTDSQTAIEIRLATAREELKQAHQFDYQITNNNLDTTLAELEEILKSEKCL